MMIVANSTEQSWPYTLPVNGGGAKMKAAAVCTAKAAEGSPQIVRVALITVRLQNTSSSNTAIGVTVLQLMLWHHGNTRVGGTQEPHQAQPLLRIQHAGDPWSSAYKPLTRTLRLRLKYQMSSLQRPAVFRFYK